MKSTLRIITQQTKTLNNIKFKQYDKPEKKIPKHMKKFPNFKYGKSSIIHYEKRIKNDFKIENLNRGNMNLPIYKYRIDPKIEKIRPPMNDFINFRMMSGNEILINMKNSEHFRNSELSNALYELSRRVHLKINKEETNRNWEKHKFVKIFATVAFDRLDIKDSKYWLKVESICDRLLHKLNCRQIISLLSILNRNEMRGTREFSHKLVTILPIHTPSLRSREMIKILEICHESNLNAERLINYFIIPKIERSVQKFNFENYLDLLKILSKMKYQEDPIFWSDYVMPCIFNFELTFFEAKKLWENYLNIKINCPSLELAKYFILIEDILEKFENLAMKSSDVNNMRLKIEKDYSLIPKRIENKGSNIKIKRLQNRISEKEGKENVLRDLGLNSEKSESNVSNIENSLNRLLEIKDWKKAKYDFNQAQSQKLKGLEKESIENQLEERNFDEKIDKNTKKSTDENSK